jgi:acyl carrier protein
MFARPSAPARAGLAHNKIARRGSCQHITLYVKYIFQMQPPAPARQHAASAQPKFGHQAMLDRTDMPADRITSLINRMLTERSLRFAALPDDDLRSLGLSSLDMVNLVLAVESEFDVSIPDADITPARFRSIATIAALVSTLLPAYAVT